MKKSMILGALVFLFAAIAPAAAGETSRPCPVTKEPVTLDLKDAAITDVFKFWSGLLEKQITLSPDVEGRITLKLEAVPADAVFSTILDTMGLSCNEMPDGTWQIEPLGSVKAPEKPKGEFEGYLVRSEFSIDYLPLGGSAEKVGKAKFVVHSGERGEFSCGHSAIQKMKSVESGVSMKSVDLGCTVEIVPTVESPSTTRLMAKVTMRERIGSEKTIQTVKAIETSARVGKDPVLLTSVFLDTGGRIEVYYTIPEIGKNLRAVAKGIENR